MKFLLSLICVLTIGSHNLGEPKIIAISDVDNLEIDQFGFAYISIGDKLTKYNADFEPIASFSEPLLGEITDIDLTNALNPVLYFGETIRVGILDNRLNESQTLSLLELGFYDPKLVSVSDERHLWIYDQSEDKLIRFSTESNRRTNQSLNISQVLGEENQPNQLYSTFEKVYLNVPEKGILVFDPLGAFVELISIKDIKQLVVYKNDIYYWKENHITRLDAKGKSEKIAVELTDIKTFDIHAKKIYIVRASGIEIRDHI